MTDIFTNPAATVRHMFTVKEVSAMLNLSEKTIRRLVQRGLLHRSNAIRHIRIPKQSVDGFVKTTSK